PSQFAALVASELDATKGILEIGCGNGRDAIFFSSRGHPVKAIDASEIAIEKNRSATKGNPLIKFIHLDARDVRQLISEYKDKINIIYSRFFLHSITDDIQEEIISSISSESTVGTRIFFEYRTTKDEKAEKIFGQHFRRYIDHDHLVRSMSAAGLEVVYETSGNGMAYYKGEDPHVGRIIAQKSAR
nr:class I SAM-dependent methyltransferase [Enterobacter roggenkampii]